MSIRIYHPPTLYEALKAEGYTLPDETADISLELPVDGVVQLILRINVTPELMKIVGRALIRIVETDLKLKEIEK